MSSLKENEARWITNLRKGESLDYQLNFSWLEPGTYDIIEGPPNPGKKLISYIKTHYVGVYVVNRQSVFRESVASVVSVSCDCGGPSNHVPNGILCRKN